MLSDDDQTALRGRASRFARARPAPDCQEPEATGCFVIAIDAALPDADLGERHAAFKARPAPRIEALRA